MQVMSETRREELVEAIFDARYLCKIAPIFLDAIAAMPTLATTATTSLLNPEAGCTHTVLPGNGELLMDAMFGSARYTGDERADSIISKRAVDKQITISQMAEVIAVEGVFQLDNPREATVITDLVNEYTNGLRINNIHIPFYHMPPDKDMAALYLLSGKLTPLSQRISEIGEGIGDWADLASLFSVTGIFTVGEDNPEYAVPLQARPITPTVKQQPMAPTRLPNSHLPDPYSF